MVLVNTSPYSFITNKRNLKNHSTATLQADLAQAYAEKASLEEELASARLAIERHQRQSKHDTNRLNSEVRFYVMFTTHI